MISIELSCLRNVPATKRKIQINQFSRNMMKEFFLLFHNKDFYLPTAYVQFKTRKGVFGFQIIKYTDSVYI